MKKSILLSLLMLFVAFVAFGQQVTDSTSTVTYTFGDSFMQFLTKNMWTLLFTAFFIISEWLGQTGKVKEGSIWAWIINIIGKFLKSKTAVIKSKKAKFMDETQIKMAKGLKILVFGLLLSGIGLTASAQTSHTKGFFKPVSMNPGLKEMGTKAGGSGIWLFRPTVEISAVQLTWNKTNKNFDASALTSAGMGIGYQHFVDNNGKPYNNFGVNALMLFNVIPTESNPASISGALTLTAFEYLNVGAGYDFGLKVPFILTGVTMKF